MFIFNINIFGIYLIHVSGGRYLSGVDIAPLLPPFLE